MAGWMRRTVSVSVSVSVAVLVGLAAVFGMIAQAQAQAQESAFSDAEQAEIETILRTYLMENPEIIMEAVAVLQAREEQAAEDRARDQLAARGDELFDSPTSPVMGNPDGDVTLVEFFDYNCGYCKRVLDDVFALVEEDDNVRIVFKELPILHETSVLAARAALAAQAQGLYVEYHNALMAHRGRMSEEVVFDLARQVGLDVEQLRTDMESDAVAREIAANMALAQALGIRGTPAFIVGDQVIPGAVGIDVLREVIAQARAESG